MNCGPRPSIFPRAGIIAVGFGVAAILKDGNAVWREKSDDARWKTGRSAEAMARKDPDHDWRIVLHAPLSSREYQRQDGKWVLVKQDMGFA